MKVVLNHAPKGLRLVPVPGLDCLGVSAAFTYGWPDVPVFPTVVFRR